MVLLGASVAKEAFWVYVTIVKPIVHLISSDSLNLWAELLLAVFQDALSYSTFNG